MGQERLNHAMAMHTHKSRTDEVNLTSVAQQFITFNDRLRHTFGRFDT